LYCLFDFLGVAIACHGQDLLPKPASDRRPTDSIVSLDDHLQWCGGRREAFPLVKKEAEDCDSCNPGKVTEIQQQQQQKKQHIRIVIP
jgi:hypothetical protein